ncbi:MAG: hypothetical protein HY874_00725 [Chloroflexi bacterium]|nr:hypothetical protein [Chloroflexota bacterium]
MRANLLATAAMLLVLGAAATACSPAMTTSVAFVNPSAQPLFVAVNERESFEVPADGEVRHAVPLDRWQPMTITARDARGITIFATTTSLPRIKSAGNRVDLQATGGERFDPLLQQYPGMP